MPLVPFEHCVCLVLGGVVGVGAALHVSSKRFGWQKSENLLALVTPCQDPQGSARVCSASDEAKKKNFCD